MDSTYHFNDEGCRVTNGYRGIHIEPVDGLIQQINARHIKGTVLVHELCRILAKQQRTSPVDLPVILYPFIFIII